MEQMVDTLLEGYFKFRREVFPEHKARFADLSRGQSPHTMFITCADSRIDPNLITQSDPGDIFVLRNVGNIVPPYGEFTGGTTSAIEYAIQALGVRNVIVLGHSDCGAMCALMHPEKVAGMPGVRSWLHHAQAAHHVVHEMFPHAEGENLLRVLTEENVVMQLEHLKTHPSIAARLRRGGFGLNGWYYDIADGMLEQWDSDAKVFTRLA